MSQFWWPLCPVNFHIQCREVLAGHRNIHLKQDLFSYTYYKETLHYHTGGYLSLHQGVSSAAQTLTAFSDTHGYVRHMHRMVEPMELPGPSGLTAGSKSKRNTLGVSQTAPDGGYWFQPPSFGLVSEFRFRHLMLETNLVSALQPMEIKSLKWVKPWEPLLTPRADTYIWLAEPGFELPGQQWKISSGTTPLKVQIQNSWL